MKLTISLFFLAIISANAAVYSQNFRFTMSESGVTIKKVLKELENSSSYRFFYSENWLYLNDKVDIAVNDEKIENVLENLFKNSALTYKVFDEDLVVIIPKNDISKQQITVKGVVRDLEGNALPGVNVVEVGTTNGAVTNLEGQYTISVGSPDAALSFSYVGFLSEKVEINGKAVIDITLIEDIQSLEEVVVIGYGSVKKSDLTGSVSAISSDDFEKQPLNRAENILQGRTSGVQITNTSGAPGGNIKIRIRGVNSINSSNEPLVVIDGFIGGNLNNVNPSDIASINVLKDASATTIYGSRAANGVVLVTTKRGKQGESQISFDTYVGIKMPEKLDLLDGAAWAENVNREDAYYGIDPTFSSSEIEELRRTGGTDWQDVIFRNAIEQNYNLSFSGGLERFNYFISARHNSNEGIVVNGENKLYSIRTNFDFEATKWLHTTLNLNVTRQNRHMGGTSSAIIGATTFGPGLPIYDETGEYFLDSQHISSIFMNPLFLAMENNTDSENNIIEGLGKIDFTLTDELTFSVTGNGYLNSLQAFGTSANEPGEPISEFAANTSSASSAVFQSSAQLNFDKVIGNHSINALLATEAYMNVYKNISNSAKGFPTTSVGPYQLALAETQTGTSGFSKYTLQSFLGRVNYKLLDKYLLTATFRVDGSSKFEGNNKYATFPAVAFAWNLGEEEFIKNIDLFSSLKLRTSWGLTGEQGIGPYSTNQLMDLTRSAIIGSSLSIEPGIGPGRSPNPGLRWETSEQLDLGLDIGVLNGRLQLTADVYQKRTHDLLIEVNTPTYTGVASVLRNLGEVENRGIDIELSAVPVSKPAFSWQTSFNISHNKNKVTELGTENGAPVEFFIIDDDFIIQKGEPLGQMYGLVYKGIWQTDEAVEAEAFHQVPGETKYGYDISPTDTTLMKDVIGNGTPKLIWGFSNDIVWKNVYLNVFIQAIHGFDLWNTERYYRLSAGADILAPTDPDGTDVWSPSNPDAVMPAFSSTIEDNSSFFVEKGDYIRLKNVTLGYMFNNSNKKLPFKKLNVYVSGANLLTITDYTGYDPEATTSSNDDVKPGRIYGAYPNSRVITFGLKADF